MSEPNTGAAPMADPETTAMLAPVKSAEVPIEILRYREELAEKMGLPSPYGMALMKSVANDLVQSGMVPSCFRQNPMAVFLAVMRGREMGLGPMESVLETFWVAPQGRLGMYANRMLHLLHRNGVKSKFLVETPERCEILFTPPGDNEPYTATFDIAEAKQAGLVKSDSNWAKWPTDMCRARAISRGWRALAGTFKGDANLYSREELQDIEQDADDQRRVDQVSGAGSTEEFRAAVKPGKEKKEAKPKEPVPVDVKPEPVTEPVKTNGNAKEAAPGPRQPVIDYVVKMVMGTPGAETKAFAVEDPPQDRLESSSIFARAQANKTGLTHLVFRRVDGLEDAEPSAVCNPPAKKTEPETPPAKKQSAQAKPTEKPSSAPPEETKQEAPQRDPKEGESLLEARLRPLIQSLDPKGEVAPKTWGARFMQFLTAYLGVPSKEVRTDPNLAEALDDLEWLASYDANEFRMGPAEAGERRRNKISEIKAYVSKQSKSPSFLSMCLAASRKTGGEPEDFQKFFEMNELDFMSTEDSGAFMRLFLRTRKASDLRKLAKDHNLSIAKCLAQMESEHLKGHIESNPEKVVEAALSSYCRDTRAQIRKLNEEETSPAKKVAGEPAKENGGGLFSDFE